MDKENTLETNQPLTDPDINTDENVNGQTHLNEPVAEEDPLTKIHMEMDELKDKYMRLAADFDNYRKRASKERLEYMQSAGKDVIVALLDVLDDSERAEKELAKKETDEKITREGVILVFHKLRNILQSKGLKAMDSIGKEFDIEFHEAITQLDVTDEAQRGKVIDEVQKGYFLNDKIIRHAKVVVGK
jgi:molecular chaperone GrpE